MATLTLRFRYFTLRDTDDEDSSQPMTPIERSAYFRRGNCRRPSSSRTAQHLILGPRHWTVGEARDLQTKKRRRSFILIQPQL